MILFLKLGTSLLIHFTNNTSVICSGGAEIDLVIGCPYRSYLGSSGEVSLTSYLVTFEGNDGLITKSSPAV